MEVQLGSGAVEAGSRLLRHCRRVAEPGGPDLSIRESGRFIGVVAFLIESGRLAGAHKRAHEFAVGHLCDLFRVVISG